MGLLQVKGTFISEFSYIAFMRGEIALFIAVSCYYVALETAFIELMRHNYDDNDLSG